MTTVTPKKQIIYNTRKYQKTAEFSNSTKAGIYLSRYINNLLRSLVDSEFSYTGKIIGCDPYFHNLIPYDEYEYFKVLISPGKLILDSTLVEVEEPNSLTILLHNHDYDEVIVVCYFEYNTSKKLQYALFLRNSTDNSIIDKPIPYENYVVLARFRVIRDSTGHIIAIKHPYGEWRTSLYSEFLLSIDPTASIVGPLTPEANKIYSLLESDPSLYDDFKIDGIIRSIITPLFLDTSSILKYKTGKINPRYLLSDLGGFYSLKNDINLRYRMEILS